MHKMARSNVAADGRQAPAEQQARERNYAHDHFQMEVHRSANGNSSVISGTALKNCHAAAYCRSAPHS
jgi:hypothetical protein